MRKRVAARSRNRARASRRTVEMEEGTKTKKTVFVGGIGDDVDEAVLVETFSAFGEESRLRAS